MANEERIIQTRRKNVIGENIKRIRKEKGLKAVEVIARLELRDVPISASSYAKIEKGLNNPTIDFMLAITKVLECSYDDIFYINEKR